MGIDADVPPARVPIVDAQGLVTSVWYRAFLAIWLRTGGRRDAISDIELDNNIPVSGDVSTLRRQVDSLGVEIASLPEPGGIAQLNKRVESIEADLASTAPVHDAALHARVRDLEALAAMGF